MMNDRQRIWKMAILNVVFTKLVFSIPAYAGYDLSLFWTKWGAIGSCIGSFFSCIALCISIAALVMPYQVRLTMDFSSAIQLRKNNWEMYEIQIGNVGARPVTINNIYLVIEKKQIPLQGMGNMLCLCGEDPPVPKRLEQGQELVIYLYREIMLREFKEKKIDGRIGVRVDVAAEKMSKMFWTKYKVNNLMQDWIPIPDDELYL